MSEPPAVAPARPDEREAAFRLIFRHLSDADQSARLANALRLVEAGELDPAGVLVARGRAGRLLGALVCLPVPGASGLLWPPQAAAGAGREAAEDALVRHAVSWLRGRGARLGQALLPPQDVPAARPLERNGFDHVTTLWYMQHDLDAPPPGRRGGRRVVCVPYAGLPDRDLFHRTLLRTYEGTLDCPEVNGARTVEEVLEGHRAQGRHDPGRWWLARAGGEAVGVLLMAEMPEWDSWDVSYVGVVPEARRRGFGRELVARALAEARRAGAPRVTLSVDARNRPAWELYTDLGFEAHDRREVYLAVWQ
jgi:ribosomal protein S18 acetylase RimI-like enzyme